MFGPFYYGSGGYWWGSFLYIKCRSVWGYVFGFDVRYVTGGRVGVLVGVRLG